LKVRVKNYKLKQLVSTRCQWLTSVILATWENEIGRLEVQFEANTEKYLQITRAKWTGGVAQVGGRAPAL
jgi:hypothetical protein